MSENIAHSPVNARTNSNSSSNSNSIGSSSISSSGGSDNSNMTSSKSVMTSTVEKDAKGTEAIASGPPSQLLKGMTEKDRVVIDMAEVARKKRPTMT